MERKPLILGVDPGTTIAYALLDLKGNMIAVRSGKGFTMAKLIEEATSFGRVVMVATDKGKLPGFVGKVAASLGARVFIPKLDLKQQEKRILVAGYEWDNCHERDALAAAVQAFREISPTMAKIDMFIQKQNKTGMADVVKERIIKNYRLNPRGILEDAEIEKAVPPKEMPKMIPKPKPASAKKHDEAVSSISHKVSRLAEENKILRNSNVRLREIFVKLSKDVEHLKAKASRAATVDSARLEQALAFKERRIVVLSKESERKSKDIASLKSEIDALNEFILKSANKVIMKKLPNLGFGKAAHLISMLRVSSEDYVFVQNPDEISERILSMLSSNVNAIVVRKSNKLIEARLPVISIGEMKLIETDNFALISMDELEKAKRHSDILGKIVKEYRMQRII